MSSHAFVLEEALFRNHAAYEQVLGYFKGTRGDIVPVLSGNEIIGALLSPDTAKELIAERILKRLAERPELLEELTNRIENDDIVE